MGDVNVDSRGARYRAGKATVCRGTDQQQLRAAGREEPIVNRGKELQTTD